MLQRILELRGFEVLAASSGEEAARIQENFPRTIRLLLSDVSIAGHIGSRLGDKTAGISARTASDAHVGIRRRHARSELRMVLHQKALPWAALMDRINDVLHSERRDHGMDHFDTRL